MKLSEAWLREWVNPALTREQLCHELTMAGLEVDELAPVAEGGDYTIDISITPNRGDCLSVKGVARDLSAITNTPWKNPTSTHAVAHTITDSLPIKITAPAACPRYLGRIIRGVKEGITTPVWLKERLSCSGIQSIHPIVDVTNYVMLELGQPMHAFDLNTIQQGIQIRLSTKGEKINLLDGSKKTLDDATLVIADNKNPLAIAGVMGGLDSCVTTLTTDILLESAYFDAKTIARQRQHYQLNSDAAYRFERGVDFTIQRDAIERATQLILDLLGGNAGPVIECADETRLPNMPRVALTKEKLDKTLGISINPEVVTDILNRLELNVQKNSDEREWLVQVPTFRFDITQSVDLIEEIARLNGYDQIPTHKLKGELQAINTASTDRDLSSLKQALSDHAYHEIISYSFVDKAQQQLLDPGKPAIDLLNPISAEMNVMRTNLWPGLLSTLIYNLSRQQNDVRLFETGLCFIQENGKLAQVSRLGGIICGRAQKEQWGTPSRKVDFYDLKGHLSDVLGSLLTGALSFKQGEHAALHPGQTASLYLEDDCIGIMGALHPSVSQALDLSEKAFVFEIDLAKLKHLGKSLIQEVSKFPEIRRDIAILVNQTIPADKIQDTIKVSAGDWLKDVFIFDVYQGKGISPGLKSIALGLIWQHPARTLIDEEVTALMEQVTGALKGQLGAELRS